MTQIEWANLTNMEARIKARIANGLERMKQNIQDAIDSLERNSLDGVIGALHGEDERAKELITLSRTVRDYR